MVGFIAVLSRRARRLPADARRLLADGRAIARDVVYERNRIDLDAVTLPSLLAMVRLLYIRARADLREAASREDGSHMPEGERWPMVAIVERCQYEASKVCPTAFVNVRKGRLVVDVCTDHVGHMEKRFSEGRNTFESRSFEFAFMSREVVIEEGSDY